MSDEPRNIKVPKHLEDVLQELASRSETLGVAICACWEGADHPMPIGERAAGVIASLTSCNRVREAIECAMQQSNQGGVPCIPIHDELWVGVIPISSVRHRHGAVLALIPVTPESASSSSNETPPAGVVEKAQTVAWWFNDLTAVGERDEGLAAFGNELSEAYEELTLLYRIGQNMNVVKGPQRFIHLVCEELLKTVGFKWVSVFFGDTRMFAPDLTESFYVEGEMPCPRERAQEIIRDLISLSPSDGPLVIEDTSTDGRCGAQTLGRSVIVHPFVENDEIIGAVVAGEKANHTSQISSGDLKLIGASASHLQIFLDNVILYDQTHRMFMGTLEALTASIDAKDPYTCGHSQRVAILSMQLARAMNLDETQIERIHIAGLVHDVGKIGVPESVLCKRGRLTDSEYEDIKKHPEMGARILRDIPQLEDIIPGVLYHHERFDGHGYPHGLKGRDIPLFGRIIALADCFDAMSSTRTYRRAISRADVLREIVACSGSQFDPEIAEYFTTLDFEAYDDMMARHQAAARAQEGHAA